MDILSIIEKEYKRRSNSNDYVFQKNENYLEISFYQIVQDGNLDSYSSYIKNLNNEILKFVQNNYFYKVLRFRDSIFDKDKTDGFCVFINRIQLTEIEPSKKISHLAPVTRLQDLYV